MIDEIIINDFNVQFVSELLDQQIYAEVKVVNYHVVIVTGNIINQVMIHKSICQ